MVLISWEHVSFSFSLMLLNDINTLVKSFNRKNHACDFSES